MHAVRAVLRSPVADQQSQRKDVMMDVSAWWILGAFLVGGYAGALLVALMSITARDGGSSAHVESRGIATEQASAPRWGV